MSHVVESASSRRHRRNRRTAIILVVLVALLAGAFYYAASYFNRPSNSAASGCPTGSATAAAATAQAPSPGQITVNVYNATSRNGLAASVAKDVKTRGFVIGQVANDPLKKKIAVSAELRFGPNGKQAAAVAAKLMDSVAPVQDTRADTSVDLVLGNDFKALAAEPTPTATVTPSPQPC